MNLIIQTSFQMWIKVLAMSRWDLMIVYHLHFFLNPRIWWCCFFDSSIYRIRLAGKPVWCTKTWTKTWTGDMDGHLMLWWSCLDLFWVTFYCNSNPYWQWRSPMTSILQLASRKQELFCSFVRVVTKILDFTFAGLGATLHFGT